MNVQEYVGAPDEKTARRWAREDLRSARRRARWSKPRSPWRTIIIGTIGAAVGFPLGVLVIGLLP